MGTRRDGNADLIEIPVGRGRKTHFMRTYLDLSNVRGTYWDDPFLFFPRRWFDWGGRALPTLRFFFHNKVIDLQLQQ